MYTEHVPLSRMYHLSGGSPWPTSFSPAATSRRLIDWTIAALQSSGSALKTKWASIAARRTFAVPSSFATAAGIFE